MPSCTSHLKWPTSVYSMRCPASSCLRFTVSAGSATSAGQAWVAGNYNGSWWFSNKDHEARNVHSCITRGIGDARLSITAATRVKKRRTSVVL